MYKNYFLCKIVQIQTYAFLSFSQFPSVIPDIFNREFSSFSLSHFLH